MQVGGGLRSLEAIGRVLEAGAARAILGTAAAADPARSSQRAVEEFAEHIVVGVDVRGGHVMVRGWTGGGPARSRTRISALDEARARRATW